MIQYPEIGWIQPDGKVSADKSRQSMYGADLSRLDLSYDLVRLPSSFQCFSYTSSESSAAFSVNVTATIESGDIFSAVTDVGTWPRACSFPCARPGCDCYTAWRFGSKPLARGKLHSVAPSFQPRAFTAKKLKLHYEQASASTSGAIA